MKRFEEILREKEDISRRRGAWVWAFIVLLIGTGLVFSAKQEGISLAMASNGRAPDSNTAVQGNVTVYNVPLPWPTDSHFGGNSGGRR